MNDFTEVFVQSYNTFFQQMAAFLPKLLGALVVLIIGWIIAKIIKTLTIKFLKLIRFNVVTEKARVDQFLADGGIKRTTIEILGSLLYWLVMLIVILTAFNSLGLSAASALFNQVFLFIPNIIVAILVLILGLFLASFVSQAIVIYLKNIGIENAEAIGKLLNYAVIIFVISISLTQLNIGKEMITSAFLLVFGALCLAMALAFGMGGKEWAAGVIDKYFKN